MAIPTTSKCNSLENEIRCSVCGNKLTVLKQDVIQNHMWNTLIYYARVVPCKKCLQETKKHPMEDWLPGV